MEPERILEAARLWLGTPYVHQQSTRGAGCDCLGLLRGVWRDLYGAEPEPCPPYALDWAAAGRDTLREAADRWLRPDAAEGPGVVALYRLGSGPLATHCGILTGDARLIHASNAPSLPFQGAVLTREGSALQRRRVGLWGFP